MLGRVVAEAAERFGDATAFVAPAGWSLSYRQLHERAEAVAAGLLARGVGEGDVVAIALPPSPDHVVAYVAAARIGAIAAAVNHKLTATERDAVLADAGPALTLVDAADHHPPPPAAAHPLAVDLATDAADVLATLTAGGTPADVPPLPDDPDRPVAIVFTSGTTGQPKGAVFAGRQLAFITEVDTGNRWGGGGPMLMSTSLAHLGPTTKLPGNLMRGGNVHLMDRWSARATLELTERERMAGLGGIPTQIALMLRDPEFDRFDLTCVQAIVIGGGPATPALVRDARRRFGAALSVRYSCTEAGIGLGTAFTDPPEDAEESVGRPHAGVELTIVDPATGDPVAPGQEGEVCLRSPAVMSGYWRDPAGTEAAFTPTGAVRTGDLGYVDERGRLHLVGRSKERYVRGGYNVHPQEVEAVLAAHPLVAEVAIAPRADEIMGEIGVAVVVPRDPAHPPTLDDLRAAGADRLAPYKQPEALVIVDRLPLTPMEKVDRRALAAMVAGRTPAGAD